MHPPGQAVLLQVSCSRHAGSGLAPPYRTEPPLSDARRGSGVAVIPGAALTLVSGAS